MRQGYEFDGPAEGFRATWSLPAKRRERVGEGIVRLKDMQAAASIALLLMSGWTQPGLAQQTQSNDPDAAADESEQRRRTPANRERHDGPAWIAAGSGTKADGAPVPAGFANDYTKAKSHFWNPFAPYTATNYPEPRLGITPRLDQLLQDGKIYLSLSDAVTLALENNYDVAIARINLNIADTDILRAKAGSFLRGVSTGLVANTLGGSTSTILGGGGPGATSAGTGGGGAGVGGFVTSTNGGGPVPEGRDPVVTGQLSYEAQSSPQINTLFSGGLSVLNTDTATYNFNYVQGFETGTQLTVGFNNTRVTTNNAFSNYSPSFTTGFRATATQHLLQGFGPGNQWTLHSAGEERPADH